METPWELRTATSVSRFIHYVEIDLRNKTTLEFRTVLTVPWVSLIPRFHCISILPHGTMDPKRRTEVVKIWLRRDSNLHVFAEEKCFNGKGEMRYKTAAQYPTY